MKKTAKKTQKNIPVDVRIEGGSGLFVIHSLTAKARRWVKKNVPIEKWQIVGEDGFACEGGYAQDIAKGMQENGLIVR